MDQPLVGGLIIMFSNMGGSLVLMAVGTLVLGCSTSVLSHSDPGNSWLLELGTRIEDGTRVHVFDQDSLNDDVAKGIPMSTVHCSSP